MVAALAILAGMATGQTVTESLRGAPKLNGIVLDADREPAGEFSIRIATFEVVRYRYDPKTSVDREQKKVGPSALQPGDRVEVDSSALPDSPLRYAQSVLVTGAAEPIHYSRTRPAPYRPEEERALLSRGNLQLAGVVARIEDGQLVIRTREKGEQSFRMRSDTRYLETGARVGPEDLKPDMRVYVRAGRDIFGSAEVYEVAWGQILEPR